jgi:TetR/AcrR family transcriptional repressor of mexCD-oprJ operon
VQESRLCRTTASDLSNQPETPTALRADAARNVKRILETATRVLAGDQGAGMAEVASEAGLARATLYRHFPTREDLVVAIRAQAYDDADAAIAASRLEEGTATDALLRLIERLVAVGDHYRVLQNEAETEAGGAASRKREEELSQPVLALIRRGQESGELSPDVDPQWFTRTLDALIRSALRVVSEGGITPSDAAAMVHRIVVRGLSGPAV